MWTAFNLHISDTQRQSITLWQRILDHFAWVRETGDWTFAVHSWKLKAKDLRKYAPDPCARHSQQDLTAAGNLEEKTIDKLNKERKKSQTKPPKTVQTVQTLYASTCFDIGCFEPDLVTIRDTPKVCTPNVVVVIACSVRWESMASWWLQGWLLCDLPTVTILLIVEMRILEMILMMNMITAMMTTMTTIWRRGRCIQQQGYTWW